MVTKELLVLVKMLDLDLRWMFINVESIFFNFRKIKIF